MAEGTRPGGRGRLRIYLGAAPGVGKTYAMLGEGHRRAARGTDVVIGLVEDHGRPLTQAMADGLERVPQATLTYRDTTFHEMDLDAVLARHPQVALVDELAHSNVPGSRHAKRWEDVEALLAAGIDVITTVNIQHLESLTDVVEQITGVRQRETIPDSVVRRADQVELVDMAPEALRRRMAHGNIYKAEKIDAALSRYFRVGNLTALRELALLWLADKVDEGLQRYRAEHAIEDTWEARERVVVALTGGAEGETLIRRAARITARSAGGELLALHVVRSDGLTGASPALLAAQRRLVESFGGSFHQVVGDDPARGLLEFARAENATQLVIGASRRSRLAALLSGPGTSDRVIRGSGPIDVHLVTHDQAGRLLRLPRVGGGLAARRRLAGLALALVGPPLLTAALATSRGTFNLTTDALAYLLLVVACALVGGLWPAVVGAVSASLLLNYYFTPPLYTLTISQANNVLALVIFLLVAALVALVVDGAARRTREAARATAESRVLATVAGSVLRGHAGLPALLEQAREAFGLDAVALLEQDRSAGRVPSWVVVAHAGEDPPTSPEAADDAQESGDVTLALRGRSLNAEDRRLLGAFATQAAVALETARLADAAAAAEPLAAADRARTALLAAVGHDLRTPLASAKAAVTSLRGTEVAWSDAERAELLATADEALDRLARLVDNLLDLSRLQAGALVVEPVPTDLSDVVGASLAEMGGDAAAVVVDVPAGLPPALADPVLLERVVVNLVANALRYSPVGSPPLVAGSSVGEGVELRVVDAGPGIPEEDRERVFAPFQRLGDTDNTSGVGLGLALSRGLVEAMGGRLTPEETPGGGVTMVVELPAQAVLAAGRPAPGRRERADAAPRADAAVEVSPTSGD